MPFCNKQQHQISMASNMILVIKKIIYKTNSRNSCNVFLPYWAITIVGTLILGGLFFVGYKIYKKHDELLKAEQQNAEKGKKVKENEVKQEIVNDKKKQLQKEAELKDELQKKSEKLDEEHNNKEQTTDMQQTDEEKPKQAQNNKKQKKKKKTNKKNSEQEKEDNDDNLADLFTSLKDVNMAKENKKETNEEKENEETEEVEETQPANTEPKQELQPLKNDLDTINNAKNKDISNNFAPI